MVNWKQLRNKFHPEEIKTIFVLESPPTGGKYFYNPDGHTGEILFRAMMKILDISPKTKEEGLKAFQKKGYILVDPIYEPVDKIPDKKADTLILENYPAFLGEMKEFTKHNLQTPIILVKANICRMLDKKLTEDGFNVLNNGLIIPFPMHYHMPDFEKKVRSLIK